MGKLKNENRKPTDSFLELIGLNGPWQRRLLYFQMIANLPASMLNMMVTFMAPNIDHWCAAPVDFNVSVDEWRKLAIPADNPHCLRYTFNSSNSIVNSSIGALVSNQTTSCENWEYDHSVYTNTIVEEWNLVCDQDWLISLSKSVWMFGEMLSAVISGYLSDRFGRRKITILSNFLALAFSTASAFSTSYIMFIVLRFFVAFFTNSMNLTSFILLMEVTSRVNRNSFGICSSTAWVSGLIVIPLIAWILRDWFWIQLANTTPLLILIICWWIWPESPRWLLAKNKVEEAHQVLLKATKTNSLYDDNFDNKFKEIVSNANQQNKSSTKDINVMDILRNADLRKKTLIIAYVWIVVNFVWYGLAYNTNDLSGDPFLNFALFSFVDIPATAITYLVVQWLGRVRPLVVTLIVAGVLALSIGFIPAGYPMLITCISLAGKFLIGMSFGIVILVTPEAFPTSLRNFGYGFCFLWGRLAALVAPFVRELKRVHPFAPQIVYGIMGITSGIITHFLPETKDSMSDGIIQDNRHSLQKNSKDGGDIGKNPTPSVVADFKSTSTVTDTRDTNMPT